MKLILINIYPRDTMARYLLSSYILKAYLDKYYKGNDLSVDVLNFSETADISVICNKIIKQNPDYLGYSCYIWNIEMILEIVENLRSKIKAIHIFGGPEISPSRILTFSPDSAGDYYVIGEGEKTFLSLMNYLKSEEEGSDAEVPKGVAYWLNSRLVYSENSDRVANLDKIPSIYLNGIIEDRLYARQQAFIETQRGCRFKCKYCVYHKNLPSISYYSVQRIFDEFEYLIVKKRITALRIFDAVFTSDIIRAKEILKYLLKLKVKKEVRLPWIYWEMTYHNIDEEFIELTSSLRYREWINNCEGISPKDRPQHYSEMLKDYIAINCIGIQSFNSKALKAVGRSSVSPKRIKDFMDIVKRYNIVLKVDIILGLPFETFETYFEGLESYLPYLKDTDHILNIHRLQILPGSDLEKSCATYGIRYSREAPHWVFSTPSFSEKELNYALKLTAVLFRILNSPLRRVFFEAKESTSESFYGIVKSTLDAITSSGDFKETKLIQNYSIDDNYWNNKIFREISSEWLTAFLESKCNRKKYAGTRY